MTIIGRVLLGMYKTRDKSYVNMPTEMLSADDILKVENIHAPHYDVDGNPNFYWFEAAVPKFALRRLYVPLMTCFYSALRKLNVENHSLSGSFDDALNDPKHNTWEAVLSEGQSMRDWVMSFYDIAHTWDGTPLWPKQMTDFSVYFKKDQERSMKHMVEERVQQELETLLRSELMRAQAAMEQRVRQRVCVIFRQEVETTLRKMQAQLDDMVKENNLLRDAFAEANLRSKCFYWALNPAALQTSSALLCGLPSKVLLSLRWRTALAASHPEISTEL